MADEMQSPKSPEAEKESSLAESGDESVDDREEVLLLDSDSEDDSDSERKPVEPVPVPVQAKEPREVPSIDPRIDMSLSEIVGQKNVKRYENKNSAKFVTGVDVTSKEARKKREDRAKRFGTTANEEKGEKEEDISSVLLAPGSKIGGHPVRLEAIHMTGVDDMSTQDIFSYFQSYDPSSIEWINDTSCNIVWLDPHSAARALLGMSKPREGYFKLGLKNLAQSRHLIEPDPDSAIPEPDLEPELEQEPEPMEEGGDEDDDTLDLVSDRETGEKVRPPTQRINPSTTTASTTTTPHSNFASRTEREEVMEGIQLGDEDLGPVDITYDQSLRIGKPHHQADELVLRYATHNDMKEKGAYKHSQYYIKYGNPNFGGMKGLLTETMRKKIRQGKFVPSQQARKRRYQEDSDEEREVEREEWPRKRRVPGRMERRLGEREPTRHSSPPLSPPLARLHSGSDGESGEDEEEEEEEREDGEEEEDLDAELRHALRGRGDDDDGRERNKMSRRMYADDIEDTIKHIRHTMESRPQHEPQQVVADARERLRQGRDRPPVKSRLGVGAGGMGMGSTPAPSMENLKVILDVDERTSLASAASAASSDAWSISGGEEEEEEDESTLVDDSASVNTTSFETTSFETTSFETTSFDTTSYDTTSYDTTSADSNLDLLAGFRNDLRQRLGRRAPGPKTRPGFGPSETRPTFLENLPSLQIEIREEV